jgi:acyl-CoA synthetase (AMP-forming)/AMP-acid ligase II
MNPLSLLELEARPDAPVIVTRHGTLTRGDALAEAAHIAAELGAVGAARAPVVITLDSGAGFLAGLVGAWLAGSTPVLLDPLVRRELGRAVRTIGARAVIRAPNAASDGIADDVPVVSPRGARAEPRAEAPPVPAGEPLLYLCTSGSTGEPAIVAKSFEQLDVERRFLAGELGTGLRAATLVPWCHIFGFIVSFLAPVRGGGVCDLTAGISPRIVLDRAAAGLLDLVVVVPAILRVMVRLLEEAGATALPAGCRFCSSGAALPDDLRRRFRELTGSAVTDIYGSTEAGAVAYRSDDGPWRLQPHVEWRVSEDGHLEVRSPSVSRSVAGPGEFYRIGDLVRPAGDGFVLEGRADDIVKIGGRRVSLEEIRRVLEACPSVAAAAVAVEEVRGEARLVAFVEAPEGGATPEGVKAFVRARLADHKVPRAVHVVAAFPLNPGGKVDRLKLLGDRGARE